MAQPMTPDELARFRKLKADMHAQEFDVPLERLQRARGMVEAMEQNGVNLSTLDESGTASPAHFAASIPDVAFLIALNEAGANLDVVDKNGATPAHILTLRVVTEPEAEKAARFLSRTGIRFTQPRNPADPTSAPANVLNQWPTLREHWAGWLARNRDDKTGKRTVPLLFLAGAFLQHRRRLRKCKRFIRSLDYT